MGFTMLCCTSLADRWRSLRFCLWLFLVTTMGLSSPAWAGAIGIINPQLHEASEAGYVLSADFRIDFNSRLEEAVAKGVALYFVMEFELERPRWYWMDEKVASRSQTWRLSYHALTRQYRLSTGTLHQSFASLEEALQMLARVRRWQVVDQALKPGDSYQAGLRLRLDISQLPKPFQVSALANRDWNLNSDWMRWTFVVPAPASGGAGQGDSTPGTAPGATSPAAASGALSTNAGVAAANPMTTPSPAPATPGSEPTAAGNGLVLPAAPETR